MGTIDWEWHRKAFHDRYNNCTYIQTHMHILSVREWQYSDVHSNKLIFQNQVCYSWYWTYFPHVHLTFIFLNYFLKTCSAYLYCNVKNCTKIIRISFTNRSTSSSVLDAMTGNIYEKQYFKALCKSYSIISYQLNCVPQYVSSILVSYPDH